MRWWLSQGFVLAANLLWFWGVWLLRYKHRAGWLVYCVSELFWLALAYTGRLWSIIPFALVGLVMFTSNYRKWGQDAVSS